MAESIKGTGIPFHGQAAAELFAADYIHEVGVVAQSVLEDAYDEWLHEMHRKYEDEFPADFEMVCGDSKERRFKCLENLSNHGNYEITHDIVTVNIRECNRLGHRTPGGLKFREKWFMTRKRAEGYGYPVHDTALWDNNINKLAREI